MSNTSASRAVLKPLIGTDEATIDDKGRVLVGKKKRERLGEDFAIAFGESGCLVAYPQAGWQKMVEEILSYPAINQGRQQYGRLMLGTADDDLNFDGQGRVVIPQKLRELARLKERVMLVGCGDTLEVWAREEYERYLEDPDGYARIRREAVSNAYHRMVGQ